MSKPINLTAVLGKRKTITKTGEKFKVTIHIKADELWFNPDEKAVSAKMANAIVEQIKDNLKSGRAPNGSPMPHIAASTIEWRKDEEAQGRLGGRPVRKNKDSKVVSEAVRNYNKDYRSRVGSFTPRSGGSRGVVSGMLLNSIVARPDRSGKGFTIYVAARRGVARPGEALTAMESVFGRTLNTTNLNVERQPKTAAALKQVEKRILNQKIAEVLKDAVDAVRDAKQLSDKLGE